MKADSAITRAIVTLSRVIRGKALLSQLWMSWPEGGKASQSTAAKLCRQVSEWSSSSAPAWHSQCPAFSGGKPATVSRSNISPDTLAAILGSLSTSGRLRQRSAALLNRCAHSSAADSVGSRDRKSPAARTMRCKAVPRNFGRQMFKASYAAFTGLPFEGTTSASPLPWNHCHHSLSSEDSGTAARSAVSSATRATVSASSSALASGRLRQRSATLLNRSAQLSATDFVGLPRDRKLRAAYLVRRKARPRDSGGQLFRASCAAFTGLPLLEGISLISP